MTPSRDGSTVVNDTHLVCATCDGIFPDDHFCRHIRKTARRQRAYSCKACNRIQRGRPAEGAVHKNGHAPTSVVDDTRLTCSRCRLALPDRRFYRSAANTTARRGRQYTCIACLRRRRGLPPEPTRPLRLLPGYKWCAGPDCGGNRQYPVDDFRLITPKDGRVAYRSSYCRACEKRYARDWHRTRQPRIRAGRPPDEVAAHRQADRERSKRRVQHTQKRYEDTLHMIRALVARLETRGIPLRQQARLLGMNPDTLFCWCHKPCKPWRSWLDECLPRLIALEEDPHGPVTLADIRSDRLRRVRTGRPDAERRAA